MGCAVPARRMIGASLNSAAAARVRTKPAEYTVNTAAEPSAARLLFSHEAGAPEGRRSLSESLTI